MTALHAEYETVVAIANRLYARDEVAWRVMLARAHALDITLLALIYARLREVRDEVARVAFERRVSIGEVARERLAELRAARPANNAHKLHKLQSNIRNDHAGLGD